MLSETHWSGVLGKVSTGNVDLWVIGWDLKLSLDEITWESGKWEKWPEGRGGKEGETSSQGGSGRAEPDALRGGLCCCCWGQGDEDGEAAVRPHCRGQPWCCSIHEGSRERVKDNLWNEKGKVNFSRTFNTSRSREIGQELWGEWFSCDRYHAKDFIRM